MREELIMNPNFEKIQGTFDAEQIEEQTLFKRKPLWIYMIFWTELNKDKKMIEKMLNINNALSAERW